VQLNLSFDSAAATDPVAASGEPSAAQGQSPDAPPVIIFVRHRRARRYILRVLPDGSLRVTMPRRGSRREALAFVEASAAWVAEQRERRAAQAATPSPRSAIRPLVERWYRRKAARELPTMLMALASAHGIAVARVSVRDQRSRWGACSSRGTITLNWRLIQVPDYVREYVLIHELMHRRELNHSRRFWRLVAGCCPQHLEARRWLKREGKLLWPEHG
jgi:predicted metal-dependent hydrolase